MNNKTDLVNNKNSFDSCFFEYKGEYTGMREMRKHVAWYTAGMPHSAAVRREVNEVETYEQLERLVKDRLES